MEYEPQVKEYFKTVTDESVADKNVETALNNIEEMAKSAIPEKAAQQNRERIEKQLKGRRHEAVEQSLAWNEEHIRIANNILIHTNLLKSAINRRVSLAGKEEVIKKMEEKLEEMRKSKEGSVDELKKRIDELKEDIDSLKNQIKGREEFDAITEDNTEDE